MSDQFNRGGKNDGNRKYQSINLSQHFNKRDPKTGAKSTTGRGLQSLGKVGVSTRRLPRPAVCSSLKKENAGNDPNVALVPGGGGWGSKKESAQVESTEGEKGWKEVEDKPASKHPGFSQEFPSLGEDAPSSTRLELRPQTVKWGEKQHKPPSSVIGEGSPAMGAMPPTVMHPAMPPPQIPLPINQTFGVVQVPMSPMYGMVPVPGPIYAGVPPGAVYRQIYPPNSGTPPQMYAGATPPNAPLSIPYMYTAPPPPLHSNDETQDKAKQEVEKEKSDEKVPTKGSDYWGDDIAPQKIAAPEHISPQMGYISPYTLPFPGTPGKMKQSDEVRAEPVGKPSEEKRITYHGRTSSHSSLSEPPEDELAYDLEEKLDLNQESAPRVISRSIAKKELKAFPKEEEIEVKQILQKSEQEDVSVSWEDEESEDKSVSVWEERQKAQDGNVWNIPRSAGEGASAPSSADRYFDDDYEPGQNEPPHYSERTPPSHHRQERDRHEPRSNRDRSDIPSRRFMDNGQRKALEDASNCINNIAQLKQPEPKKQITIQQKPKVEILQKPVPSALPKPAPVQSSGAPTSNYWQEKQAERDRLEAEEERKRRELQKAEAQKARQQQYQDYRTPDQYDGSAFDEDERRQYEEEREAEREKRSIRRRGQDEFYDNDRNEKPARAERRPRRKREEVFKIEYREPRSSRESRSSREPRQNREPRDRKRHDSHEQRHESREYHEKDRYDSRERNHDPRDRYDRDERVADGRRRYNRYNFYDDPDRFYYERADVRDRPKRQDRSKKAAQSETKEESSPVTVLSEDGDFDPAEDQVEELVVKDTEVSPAEEEAVPEDEDVEGVTNLELKTSREKGPRDKSTRDQDRFERYDRDRRDPRERYDKERYERPDFTTYRREPRHSRGERQRDSRRDEPRRERRPRSERDPKDHEVSTRSDEKKLISKQKSRVEKYKADVKERRTKSERRTRRPREGEEWVSSDEQRSKSTAARAKPASEQTAEASDENIEKQEKPERPPRRARKTPSLRYYSANPADRLKSSQSVPPKSTTGEDKSKEKSTRSKSDVRSRETKKDSKKEPSSSKNQPAEGKSNDTSSKIKAKDPAAEAKKAKKIEKTKLEMDRLKKMTQSGMDLLTLGIYAVDGKELDDHDAADFSDGFVEVVRKKSKKEPEPEKKPTTSKSKKSKKSSSKSKKVPISQEEAKQATIADAAATASTTSASPTGVEKPSSIPTSVKSWSSNTAVDLPLMSNIWSNPKKNAWDKPLTFSEKQTIDPREILAPISGESTSLFSSDADLAKKTKEKNWRGSEARPPRFSKVPEKPVSSGSATRKTEKKQSKVELKEEEEEEKELTLPSSVLSGSSSLDLNIPPVVEDLFGIRSDGEDEKTTLSSLVLDTKLTAPVVAPPVVGLSQRDRVPTAPSPPEHLSSEELSDTPQETENPPDLVSAETSTQTTPPAARPLSEDPAVQVPSLPVGEVPPPSRTPNINTAVKQMITSTGGLSLTDQLREIGEAQVAQQQADRSQFFAMQGIQGSPLMQSLQNSPGLHPDTHMAGHQHPQQPLLGHFINPPPTEMSTHILPSPHQIGGKSTSLPLMGSHPISSPLSSLGNIVNRPNPVTTADIFKSYMSPMSPTNKIYPGSNQNFVNQNIHQFMSNQFLTNQSSGNYGSPSMSPIPSQINPFAQFQQKSSSPKLQNLYNSPQGSFDGLDPTGMMSLGQQLQKTSSFPLANQQMFHQRMMPGQEMYYKLKPTDNILLQSDMSKHVDAKPFNPGGNPMQMPPPRPGMFKPELLQHVMQPNGPSPVLPHLGYKPINQGFEKETIGPRPAMVQRPITSDFSAINGTFTP
ncbi:hypothetical protein ACHWQZ_G002116 [Mnemiopsis leidyi]